MTILMDACINIGSGSTVVDVGDYSFDVEGINAGLACHQFDVMDINGHSLHVPFDVANIKWSEVCHFGFTASAARA
ncbi:MAG TPA: hypothetical protein VGQ65_22605 [Thermoanaerobaculia bacterium]|nr:hypothetical protein [Thermoanaerobaculia bacterium]